MNIAANFPCECGEGPLWHPDRALLYWIDVDTGKMFAYDPAARSANRVYQGKIIGGTTLQQDGQLLLFLQGGAIALWSPEEGLREQRDHTPGAENTRFNDVIADPEGRVFAGTMPSEEKPGRLYRLDPDGQIHTLIEEVGQPNGMAFSPDLKFFYLTDTKARTIQRFRYDRKTGAIRDGQVLIEARPGEGQPDGLTVDSQGHLWSARWDGSRIVRYDPEGKLLETILLPVHNVTSLTFVDTTIYVTSAGGSHRPQAGQHAGSLFQLEAKTPGRAEFRSRIQF